MQKYIYLLLEYGADIHARDNKGNVPYYYIHHKISAEMTERFAEAGSDLDKCMDRDRISEHFGPE